MSAGDTVQIYPLVEPFLDWLLVEVDTQSSDILICEPRQAGVDPRTRQLIILSGYAVMVWLRHRRQANPGSDALPKLDSDRDPPGE
jgi:hypothetical protein